MANPSSHCLLPLDKSIESTWLNTADSSKSEMVSQRFVLLHSSCTHTHTSSIFSTEYLSSNQFSPSNPYYSSLQSTHRLEKRKSHTHRHWTKDEILQLIYRLWSSLLCVRAGCSSQLCLV